MSGFRSQVASVDGCVLDVGLFIQRRVMVLVLQLLRGGYVRLSQGIEAVN